MHQVTQGCAHQQKVQTTLRFFNLVVEDTEEKELVEYRFKVTSLELWKRGRRPRKIIFYGEVVGVPPSGDTPLPHLERHQAWLEVTRRITKIWKTTIWTPTLSLITSSQMQCVSFGKPFQGKTETKERLCPTYGMYGSFFKVRLVGIYPRPLLLYEHRSRF